MRKGELQVENDRLHREIDRVDVALAAHEFDDPEMSLAEKAKAIVALVRELQASLCFHRSRIFQLTGSIPFNDTKELEKVEVALSALPPGFGLGYPWVRVRAVVDAYLEQQRCLRDANLRICQLEYDMEQSGKPRIKSARRTRTREESTHA